MTSSTDLESTFGASFDAIRPGVKLAPSFEATTVHALWSYFSVASACVAGRVRVKDPLSNNDVNLAMGTILIGNAGRWQSGIRNWIRRSIQASTTYLSSADSAERAGFVAEIQRANDRVRPQAKTKSISPASELKAMNGNLLASVEDMAGFNTEELEAKIRNKATHMFHLPTRLDYFFNANGRGSQDIYQHFYTGLSGEPIEITHRNELIRMNNVLTSFFGTATMLEIQNAFPQVNRQLPLLARLNVVYSQTRDFQTEATYNHDAASQASERLTQLDDNNLEPTILVLTPDAKKYFRMNRAVVGPSAVAGQMRVYQSIRGEHLLRIAGIIACLRDPLTSSVALSDIQLADWCLTGQESRLAPVYLSLTMGEAGQAFGILLEAFETFKLTGHKFTNKEAGPWLVTSGIRPEKVQAIVDMLFESNLLQTDHEGNLKTNLMDQELKIQLAMKRVGIIERLS